MVTVVSIVLSKVPVAF